MLIAIHFPWPSLALARGLLSSDKPSLEIGQGCWSLKGAMQHSWLLSARGLLFNRFLFNHHKVVYLKRKLEFCNWRLEQICLHS